MEQKTYLLSAGGTGGHLFPAQALANELRSRGAKVHLATDSRAAKYAGDFPCDEMHVIPSATFGSKNPVKMLLVLWKLYSGIKRTSKVLAKVRPHAVIGFGGYPTVPPLIAATKYGYPSLLHEQNGVMGRANKFLAGRVTAIAGGFLRDDVGPFSDKIFATGNPIRQAILDVENMPYVSSKNNEPFNLVVFGGSQGARFFGRTFPESLGLLPESLRKRVRLTLQARPEDLEYAKEQCAAHGLDAHVASFIDDMALKIAEAHLVISRSGASTVTELGVIGRPSVLVPLPHALDDDQGVNGQNMVDIGGAIMVRQPELDDKKLAKLLENKMNAPDELAEMAGKAKLAAKLNATSLLADMLEAIADGQTIKEFKEKHA